MSFALNQLRTLLGNPKDSVGIVLSAVHNNVYISTPNGVKVVSSSETFKAGDKVYFSNNSVLKVATPTNSYSV